MTLLLDVLFSFVFIGVMVWYSPRLTLIVLASMPVYVALSFIFTPILRARLNEKFNRGAENQSFLVETFERYGYRKGVGGRAALAATLG